MNRYTGTGRLTGDPEIRYTQEGKAVASFRLAINRRYKREGDPDADFFNFTAFGATADVIAKYCVKGTLIGVEAEPRNDDYTDRNGNEVHTIKFYVDRVDLLARAPGQASAAQAQTPAPAQQYQQAAPQYQTQYQQASQNPSQGQYVPQGPAYQAPPQNYQQAPAQAPQNQQAQQDYRNAGFMDIAEGVESEQLPF